MNTAFFEFLAARRSVKPDRLAAPAPSAEELNKILTVATRVPDHKKLSPWRFIVFEGDARAAAGEIFAQACEKEEREPPSHVRLDMERGRFLRAPMVVAVISSVKPRPGAPEWEQVLSVGALCFNLCLAANALGFGTSWISEWIAYSPTVREAFGLTEREKIAGFIYIGTPMEKPEERERPKLDALVKHWPA
ncbi:MAG: nitroreductase [Hyphomicrobium sp.]|uniref:nitroreductase family protein n=1 Tax=Hyphomicrobium sp. TaxID=82 RepID=UPI0039E5D907